MRRQFYPQLYANQRQLEYDQSRVLLVDAKVLCVNAEEDEEIAAILYVRRSTVFSLFILSSSRR